MMEYFGLGEHARVVHSLPLGPRNIDSAPSVPVLQEHGELFYYDYSLERLILAESRLMETNTAITGAEKGTSGQVEVRSLAGKGVATVASQSDTNGRRKSACDQNVDHQSENTKGPCVENFGDNDPCFSKSPVVARARKSSASLSRCASRGFLRRPVRSPSPYRNSPFSRKNRKRTRCLISANEKDRTTCTTSGSHKRSKSKSKSTIHHSEDSGGDMRKSKLEIEQLHGDVLALHSNNPYNPLLANDEKAAGADLVKKLMSRLSELEEMVENLHRQRTSEPGSKEAVPN